MPDLFGLEGRSQAVARAELPENVRTKTDLSITTCKAVVRITSSRSSARALGTSGNWRKPQRCFAREGINVTFLAGDIPKCELSQNKNKGHQKS